MSDLCKKISRLVEERGWNQDEFARIAGLNRLTVRGIFQSKSKLHNATVAACATALGLSVHELRTESLTTLLFKEPRRRYEEATQPELQTWKEENPERAAQLTRADTDELLSLQGTGGPLTQNGVKHFVDVIERKRAIVEKVEAICGTAKVDTLEDFVNYLYRQVQPYADRRLATAPPSQSP